MTLAITVFQPIIMTLKIISTLAIAAILVIFAMLTAIVQSWARDSVLASRQRDKLTA